MPVCRARHRTGKNLHRHWRGMRGREIEEGRFLVLVVVWLAFAAVIYEEV